MYCQKCGAEVTENDVFCQKCGYNLKENAENGSAVEQKAKVAASSAKNVEIRQKGICPHCGKRFVPAKSGTYAALSLVSIIVGILFGISALLTLMVLMGGEGFIWVFALIFGAVLALLIIKKKQVRRHMDSEPCPHCGRNHKGEQVGTPAATSEVVQERDGRAKAVKVEETTVAGGTYKVCARCNAKNPKDQKACTSCGFSFGKVVNAVADGKKVRLTTCNSCGSVYQLKANWIFAVIMAALACLGIFLIKANAILGLAILVVSAGAALLHIAGILHYPGMKCPVCGGTPMSAYQDKRLLSRKDNALVQAFARLNAWMESNVGKLNLCMFLPLLAALVWCLTMFASKEVTLSLEDIIDSTEDFMYVDIALNFGDDLHIIATLASFVLWSATILLTLIPATRRNGVAFLTSVAAVIPSVILMLGIGDLESFTYTKSVYVFGERIKTEYFGECSLGGVGIGLVVSAVLLVATVFVAYMVEKEKRYQALLASDNNLK